MPERSILVVTVDGLRASALGAYGNTLYPTPSLDELAAESFLFDSCYAPSADLAANYRALWQSVHPLRPPDEAANSHWLPRAVAETGLHATLLSDDEQVAELGQQAGFDSIRHVAHDAAESSTAEGAATQSGDVSNTTLGRVFADACEVIVSANDGPRLVWVHAQGMYGPWDAPLELQHNLRDEEDPPPIDVAAPPDLVLTAADDPDTIFRYATAYAAQVMVLDACWRALAETVREQQSAREWLVTLIGVRGFPLGEHQRIGGVDTRLHTEQLHVPWLVRFPDGAGRLARTNELVSQLDLLPTLLGWLRGNEGDRSQESDGRSALPLVGAAVSPWRNALIFGARAVADRAIRTSAWSLRFGAGDERELYVRPDDRWEANDVANRCPDVVDELAVAGDQLARQIQTGAPQ